VLHLAKRQHRETILICATGTFAFGESVSRQNPPLTFGGAAGGDPFVSGQTMRKVAFDRAPARGEIRIAIGQGPDRVQVIRQDHGGFDREGMSCPHPAKRRAQQSDVLGQQAEPPVGQIDRKEITAAG